MIPTCAVRFFGSNSGEALRSRCLPLVLLAVFSGAAAEFVPPPGAGLVDVKAVCGAKGDGTSDDTDAPREAFEAGKARPGKHGAARPTPIIGFGKGSRSDWHFAPDFDQRLLNPTIEAGAGNPGAVGVLCGRVSEQSGSTEDRRSHGAQVESSAIKFG
jgi:hypothetical protein